MDWAIIEVFGHRTYVGQVEEATLAGAPVLRVHVPELVENDKNWEWRENTRWSRRRERRYPEHVVELGGAAIFSLTRVPEANARERLQWSHRGSYCLETLGEWEPDAKALPSAIEDAQEVEDCQDERGGPGPDGEE